jgi:IS30 family transposase
MRKKGQHLTPIERRIVATQYADGVPMKVICAENNMHHSTVVRAARSEAFFVPRKRQKTTVMKAT